MKFEWDDHKEQINSITLIVMVVYTERTDVIRIISARLATTREKEAYYNA